MQIDPLLAPVLAGYSLDTSDDIVAARSAGRATAAAIVGRLTDAAPASVRIEDRIILVPGELSTDTRPIEVRIYTPAEPRSGAALVFAHGGGWATGSPTTANEHCANLTADSGVVVVSVAYRLIPEHPYPDGLDDVYDALGWVAQNAGSLGIDAARIAIGGESAGANLAAAAALRSRNQGGPALALALLEVPVLDLLTEDSPSWADVHQEFPVYAEAMTSIVARYVEAGADPADDYVSPLLAADLRGLPRTVLLATEIDPVRDDAERFARRLTTAGVDARFECFTGLVHGTQSFTALLPSARRWHDECVEALRSI